MKFPFQEINFSFHFVVTSRKGKPQSSPNKIHQDIILQKPQAKHFSENKYFPSFIDIQTPHSQPHILLGWNDLVKTNLVFMRPVTQWKWHLLKERARRLAILKSSATGPARLTEVIQQPEAPSPQHYDFGKASLSGHHPPSDEKRHTPSLYFISYPKSKQLDILLALKPAPNYTDLLQLHSVAESSPSTHPFSSKTWSVFLFNYGGYHHAPPQSGRRGRRLLPRGFAGQALRWPHSTTSWGKKSWFSPAARSGLAHPDRNSWQRTPRLACPGILKFIFKSCYTQSSWALGGPFQQRFFYKRAQEGLEILPLSIAEEKKKIKNTSFPIPPSLQVWYCLTIRSRNQTVSPTS